MNRVDRLTAILLSLQEKKCRGEDLAQRFEVSRRTIMRDIQALCEMNIPIVAEWGPAGGYSLPNVEIEPLPLTLSEAFALSISIDADASRVDDAVISLRAKLRSLIPREIRGRVDDMMNSVELRRRPGAGSLPFFDLLLAAARNDGWVRVDYRSMRGPSSQLLQPRKLYLEGGFWYLNAYSRERGEERVYRVDRISRADDAEAPAEGKRPATGPSFGDSALPEVVIVLTRRGVMEIERNFPWGELSESEEGGELRLRCPPDEYPWLCRVVMGLAGEACAVAPGPFVDQLRRKLAETLRIYDNVDTSEKR